MGDFRCKFKIGDEVELKSNVRSWAVGDTEGMRPRKVVAVAFIEQREPLVSTGGWTNQDESKVIFLSESKDFALQFLAERMRAIAAGGTEE